MYSLKKKKKNSAAVIDNQDKLESSLMNDLDRNNNLINQIIQVYYSRYELSTDILVYQQSSFTSELVALFYKCFNLYAKIFTMCL